MKFGKDFKDHIVPEWIDAYTDYTGLKRILRDLRFFNEANKALQTAPSASSRPPLSLSKALSGLSPSYRLAAAFTPDHHNRPPDHGRSSPPLGDIEDQAPAISVTCVPAGVGEEEEEEEEESYNGSTTTTTTNRTVVYKTNLLKTPAEGEGGEYEVAFFAKLDQELNKVNAFYKDKVEQVMSEAGELDKQMHAFIALRLKVVGSPGNLNHGPIASHHLVDAASSNNYNKERWRARGSDGHDGAGRNSSDPADDCRGSANSDRRPPPDPFDILDRVRINNSTSAITSVLMDSKEKELSFSKEELKAVQERLKLAFVDFYQKLRLLSNYSHMNLSAFSKIMKKYEKITSRTAAKSYMKIVDKSFLGSSDQVNVLLEKVEDIFVKQFFNADRKKGMKSLRLRRRRRRMKEQHRLTFFSGFFSGCTVALLTAIILMAESRKLIAQQGIVFMENMLRIYSFFAFIVLHMLVYAADTYFWRRCRINYPFIFNFKQGTELAYPEVFLLGSGLAVVVLASFLVNFHLVMRLIAATGEDHMTLAKMIPLGLLTVVLCVTLCPINIVYRSSRFLFLKSLFRCICAPFYEVTLPDFFLADQLTSQVQAIRNLEFFICFYSRGDFSQSQSKCHENDVYNVFYFIIALIPYWIRCLQCLRRLIEEGEGIHGVNAVKYLLTIIAVLVRTVYEFKKGRDWLALALFSSAVAVSMNIYYDLVVDWGLLRWRSRNFLLRDRLMVSRKSVYFIAMAVNVLLRVAWLQLVLEFQVHTLRKAAISTTISCLEIIRRGMWSFFRLENEHLNNVGKYRAFKSVPLPFNYSDDKPENEDRED